MTIISQQRELIEVNFSIAIFKLVFMVGTCLYSNIATMCRRIARVRFVGLMPLGQWLAVLVQSLQTAIPQIQTARQVNNFYRKWLDKGICQGRSSCWQNQEFTDVKVKLNKLFKWFRLYTITNQRSWLNSMWFVLTKVVCECVRTSWAV